MRHNKFLWLWAIVALATWSCQGADGLPGPQGVQGPQGPQGEPGPISTVYEIPFTLNVDTNWEDTYAFPEAIYESDVVLVYSYEGDVETTDGGTAAVWRLLPLTEFYEAGTLQFNYDFTQVDVHLFLDASFPLDAELDDYSNFTTRIVVIPADYAANYRSSGVDFENYYEVKKTFGLPEPQPLEKRQPLKDQLRPNAI